MSVSLQHLLPLFERERAQSLPLVLATVISTPRASYTKPGAQMLIAQRRRITPACSREAASKEI